MKYFIMIIGILFSCNRSENITGIYYNGYGDNLELKKDSTYRLIKNNGSLKMGEWMVSQQGKVLFYDWINTEDEKGHQEVTYKNETLWFSLDDYNASFKKEQN